MSHRRALVFASSLLWVVFIAISPGAVAQSTPDAITGLEITPDGGPAIQVFQGTASTVTFWAHNGLTTTGMWSFTCSKTGGVVCGSVVPSSAILAAGAGREIDVNFTAPTAGAATIRLSATTGGESGFFNITVQALGPPSVIVTRNQNGDNVDRSACLTLAAGESSAWQCGDLLVTHAMPAFTTMNRARNLTLLYNSAQAAPAPLVAVAVTENATLSRPDTVYATLTVGGVLKATSKYVGWNSAPTTRQIALSYDASADPTGVYPFVLAVENHYNSGGVFASSLSGNLIVVNRLRSPYGRGWSVVGVEELWFNQPGGAILWVGGDGSARLFTKLDATHWVGAPGSAPDTIVFNGGLYTRKLRHGISVVFDTLGHHSQTIGRTMQPTVFTYTNGKLVTIKVPPTSGAGTTYSVNYDATTGLLVSLADPSNRVLRASVASGPGTLTTLTDPDTYAVQFTYDANGRMVSRTTRRGFATRFTYQNNLRLTRVAVPLNPAVADSAITTFAPWDEKGLVPSLGATDTSVANTQIFGPRVGVADDGTFWIDRWGAATRIQNALGNVTTIRRGNPTFPLLVTRVTAPDGRIDSISYNSRGNLVATLDSTAGLPNAVPTALTQYQYADNTVDSPTKVIDPEGIATNYLYNSMGLTSQVSAPNNHVTKFAYVTSGALQGSVKAVTELSVPVWDSAGRRELTDSAHTGFQLNSFGNVVSDTSPMGRVRKFLRDPQQRVSAFTDAGGHQTDYAYDELNRTTLVTQHTEAAGYTGFPADSGVASAMRTTYHYNIDVLGWVADPRTVNRGYSYDAANRVIAESDEAGREDSTFLDQAGLIKSTKKRTGEQVRYEYDAGGRRTKMAWPATTTSPADSVVTTYDNLDRMLSASTAAKSVVRTYYADGNLRTETQGGPFTITNTYAYDRASRRIWYRIGPANNLLSADSINYQYGSDGNLSNISVRWRKQVVSDPTVNDFVRFRWDAMGRRDTLIYSNGDTVRFAYDKDGMLRVLCGKQFDNPGSGKSLNFTFYNQWIDLDGMIRQTTNFFNPALLACGGFGSAITEANTYWWRHHLKKKAVGSSSMSYVYDASANIIQMVKASGTNFVYSDQMGNMSDRLLMHKNVTGNTWTSYTYDLAGRRATESPCSPSGCTGGIGARYYLYDGLGRTTGTNEAKCNSWDPIFGICQTYGVIGSSTCGYDPLGRMDAPCEASVARLGFDGENVVRTGDDGNTNTWTFVHGPGVDDPLIGFDAGLGKYLFFVTDGTGRQYAVGDRNGFDMQADGDYRDHGGKFGAGVSRSNSYDADRQQNNTQVKLSFFRNRFYDQETGRWTQEDPIGVAGGVNLFQFNRNNPAAFTDPFGLCTKNDPSCRNARLAAEGPSVSTNPGLADPTAYLGGVGRALAGKLLAKEIAAAGETVLFEGGKEALNQALATGIEGVNSAQGAAIGQALKEGSVDAVKVVTGENGVVTYSTRAGRNGYQTLARIYDESGGLKGIAQAAWDAAGKFVHGEVWK